MNNKIFSVLTLFLLLTNVALATMMESPPERYYPDSRENSGTNQYYSVVFDGEGEAAVAAKLTFQNYGNEVIKEITLKIPGSVRLINAVQEIQKVEKVCNYTRRACPEIYKWDDYYKDCKEVCDSWSDRYNNEYLPLEKNEVLLADSKEIKFVLTDSIKPQETGTIILYYKVNGYANKSLGVYNFKFQTIKSDFDVSYVRVSMNLAEDLILKGGSSNVNYDAKLGGFEGALYSKTSELSVYSSYIESQPGFVKEARELDPEENFKVEGSYSRSWFLLNFWKVSITVLVIAGVLLFVLKYFKKMKLKKRKNNVFVEALIASLISSSATTLLWYLGAKSIELMDRFFYAFSSMWSVLMVLTGFLLLLFIILLPALHIGKKYGLIAGAITLISTLFLVVVMSLVLAIFLGNTTYLI
ncbi:hypothetical protein HY837_03210 [archaeon]|nr:hypothetical protein [archaeon]